MSFALPSLALLLVSALHVLAESHTVRFQNNCGTGTPKLIQAGQVLSTGEDYTSDGPLESAIAYLDRNDECLLNGENCAIVEMNLNNPTCAGCGSSVDISLIPSHAFNVETGFAFFGGDGDACDGLGAVCADTNCNTAFFESDDNQVQRACQAGDVNLLITFCGGGTTRFTEAVTGSLSGGQSSSSGSDSASESKAASPSSSTEAASPTSSQAATASPTASPAPMSSARSSSQDAESSQTAIENVGGSSAIPSDSAITSASPASSTSPTCRRKSSRLRRAKRASSFSRHARWQNRAHALSGIHDSQV